MSFYISTRPLDSAFRPVIIERGRAYFESELVQRLTSEPENRWTATVMGSEPYWVRIQFLDDHLAKADCTCPYAEESPCKHIVAVLFAIEVEAGDLAGMQEVKTEHHPKKDNEDLSGLLKSADKKELSSFIEKVAQFNPEIEQQFRAFMTPSKKVNGKPAYRKIVKKALAPARRKRLMYGSEARRHLIPVYELLEQAEKIKTSGSTQQVIEICQVVTEEMVPALQFIDDSNADVGDAIRWAINLLYEMSSEALKDTRPDFLNWCLKSMKDKRYEGWDFDRDFMAMAVELAQTDKQVATLNKLLDERISALETSKDDWSSTYNLETTVSEKIKLMRKMGRDKEADGMLSTYRYLPRVCAKMIETAWSRGELDRVKELAEEALKRFDEKAPGLRKDWQEWLLKVSEERGDTEDVLNRAQALLEDDPAVDRYLKVKKLVVANNWDSYLRETLLPSIKLNYRGRALLPQIYEMEQMWKELLRYLQKYPHLADLKRFQKHFNKDGELPAVDDVFKIYEEIILKELAQKTGRKYYKNACRTLRMAYTFGAVDQTQELIKKIRAEYDNRPALLEELSTLEMQLS
ncbi:MAG: SWIM zinc finger family protein [Gracilimonas sp.]